MMKKKEWSYRESLTKVATVLVVVTALTSAGMTAHGSALSDDEICKMYPEACQEIIADPIDHGTSDNTGWMYDTERREQILADMPLMTSGTPEHPVIAVDRKQVQGDVPAWLNPETNRTLVPIRFVAEALGAKVTWTPDKPNEVLIERDGLTIHFFIGDDKATVNGRVIRLDQPSILKDNRTLVPLRFIAEAFGAKVDWVGSNGPDDPRVKMWDGGKYQIWIWSPWGYWGNYSIGDRHEAGNWNLRSK